MLHEMHDPIYTGATDNERQVAEAMGAVMQSFARLAGRLGRGAWLFARVESGELCDALIGLAALLPTDSDALDAYSCQPERVQALLEAAGYPMSALQELATGNYPAFVEHVRELVRHDLAAYGTTVSGRDELLARSAHVGITEAETARLTGLSRNTVRKVIHT